MKLFFLFVLLTINLYGAYGQKSASFKHKLILEDPEKSVLNDNIKVDILIVKNSIEGEVVFTETHVYQIITSGFINLRIGSKRSLEDIEWIDEDYFVIFNIDGMLHSIFKLLSNDFAKQIQTFDDAFTIGYEDNGIIPDLNDFIKDVKFKKPFVCGDKIYYAGQYYATVKIGNQCWFAENLNVGRQIQSGIDQGTNCNDIKKYCYINLNNYCEKYGGLYQWNQLMCGETEEAVQGICPEGWHIPSHDDWTTLERHICEDVGNKDCEKHFLYAEEEEARNWQGITWNKGTNEGYMLKGVSGWKSYYGTNGNGSDIYGFSALPLSACRTNGSFYREVGYKSNWWTSTESRCGNGAWFRLLSYSYNTIVRHAHNKTIGRSVRCLRYID